MINEKEITTTLEPKIKLQYARKVKNLTTVYVADLLGLERQQYELKESGKKPFQDYEMSILSHELGVTVGELFF